MNQYDLSGLKQVYDGRCVLDIPAFQIRQGEVLAVIGPSGAGKSTLLRLLNFLEQPSQGRLDFEGAPVSADIGLEKRRRVTTVFQRPVLLKRSVAANLKFGVSLRGQKLQTGQLDEWLDRLGLTELRQQSAAKLSAGEAQRVALARALLMAPDVLLLDEPTANLDPYNVGLIERIVQEENQQRRTTVVIVTHNIFQARRLSHRTLLLLDGALVEVGETEQFFSQPGRPETRAFIRGELIY
ncbi:MAG TPA: phosphate ABC transporter ATP-binding protein [Chloroflexi bacterium]|nr:phosphate ABC transporter ATP-binding protein [Chloroflexota bacterium]